MSIIGGEILRAKIQNSNFLILINQQAELEPKPDSDEPIFKVISNFSYLCMKIKSVKEDSANWLDLFEFLYWILFFVRAGGFVLWDYLGLIKHDRVTLL